MFTKPVTHHLRWIPREPEGKYAKLLADKNAAVVDRCDAAFRLGKKGGDRYWDLLRAVFDSDFWIRAEVVRALARIADFRAFPFLLHLLSDPEGLVNFETHLAMEHLLSLANVSDQYDLLNQYYEGSARGRGAFHVTAKTDDITLNVLNRKLLEGRGIDVRMQVGGEMIRLHEGKWEYNTHTEHGVLLTSRYKSGVVLHVTLECGEEDFLVNVEATIPEDTFFGYAECDFYFVPEVSGKPLLPSNGLAPGPTRRFIMGNEVLMRRSDFAQAPRGVTLDITQSSIFRQIVVNPSVNDRFIQVRPADSEYELPAGHYSFLTALIRPHPTLRDFQLFRDDYLQRCSVEQGESRVELIGSVLRAIFDGKCITASYGLFVDFVQGDDHHTTFHYPLRFSRDENERLTAKLDIPRFALQATVVVNLTETGGVRFTLDSLSLGERGDRIKLGLLLSRRYTRWNLGDGFKPFLAPLAGSMQWKLSGDREIGGRCEARLRTIGGLGLPPVRAILEAEECPEAIAALKSTEDTFNARVVEMVLPAVPGKAIGRPSITIEVEK